MTVRVRVGFDHTGEDGKKLTAGDVVSVSDAEYLRRGPQGDGFMKEADNGAKSADAAAAKSDKTSGSTPAAGSKK